ncbi:hypothetical protein ACQPW1_27875 [Nocardia sp. CA-128927]|uniref:hypothetical protein n=1 Tax=Nocardia sp. CA-128927 TaxID=3239975 RepID=UPI003D9619E0
MVRLSLTKAVDARPNRRGSVWQIADSGQRGRRSDNTEPTSAAIYVKRDMAPDGFTEYRAMRKQGGRAFVLWADPDRKQMFARVVTRTAARRAPATYEVLGAAGESAGTIVREPGPRGGRMRTRWTVTPTGAKPLVGYKGQRGWWFVWLLLLPIQLVIGALIIVALFVGAVATAT